MTAPITLETALKAVVGDRTAKALEKAFGLRTIGELLRHYPRRYVERGELTNISELQEGEEATVLAEISRSSLRRASGRTILEVVLTDGTSTMTLTFFNQPWREKELRAGRTGLFAGKVGLFNNKRQLSHPDYELIPDGDDVDQAIEQFAGRFIAVYPAVSKLPSWKIGKCIELAIDSLDEIPDFLPEAVRATHKYPTLDQAYRQIHLPASREEADLAKERLTFDEALLLQLVLAKRRIELRALATTSRKVAHGGLLDKFEQGLPWKYTVGQIEVMAEIDSDLSQGFPMHRLLQGEVGSGKTVVALRAALIVVESGGQAAILAPTEVLAQQHFITMGKLLGDLAEGGVLGGNESGTQLALLTGSMSAAGKREALGKISSGEAGIVIGTHALLSDGVDFKDLGLVVVDEQHRFGVEQRDALRNKATHPPHLLVMTATPIPRTVAMTIFGDLDISTLRALPSGRIPIQSFVIPTLEKPHYLDRAWSRILEEVAKGHQAYVVAPRISESLAEEGLEGFAGLSESDREIARALGELPDEPKTPMTAVEELAPRLALGPLKGLKVAVLHGRQTSQEKEATMNAFSAGKIDVLVATTVIEVGVDVPNASTMVIMDADRFGVSQLHQLRGRVGRGSVAGLCLLVTNVEPENPAMARLEAVASTLDGFELARIDLEQRSEGDVLGSAQSGTRSHLRLLRVLRDEELIESARSSAVALIESDPELKNAPHLAREVEALMQEESASFVDKG
jgi:ATP-dependent DNA helicase RecG